MGEGLGPHLDSSPLTMVGMAFWEVGPYSWTVTKEQWKVEMSGPDFLRVRQGTSKGYGSWARLAPSPQYPVLLFCLSCHSLTPGHTFFSN